MRKTILLAVMLSSVVAVAQDFHIPCSTDVVNPCFNLPPKESKQKFWTKKMVAAQTFLLVGGAADMASTMNFLGDNHRVYAKAIPNGVHEVYRDVHEVNPLAESFARRGWAPASVYFIGIQGAASIGASYWLHKTGHRRLAYVVPIVCGAISVGLAVHNYREISGPRGYVRVR
jgi:hypothetical protein